MKKDLLKDIKERIKDYKVVKEDFERTLKKTFNPLRRKVLKLDIKTLSHYIKALELVLEDY